MSAIATLGTNGPQVAPLGVGTWAWGDSLYWGYGKDYDAMEVEAAFEASLDAGVTFFDTAEVYGLGLSERLLGQFLRESGDLAKEVAIATKYFPLPWRFFDSAVSEALTKSLKRLGLQRVTLYQVHMPFNFFMGEETLANVLAAEVERGRIESVGVSNYPAHQMEIAHELLAKRGVKLAVNQVRYSLLARQIERNGILETARKLGITILAYSPLAQGLLTGKYGGDRKPIGARSIDTRFGEKGLQRIAPLLATVRQLGEKYGKTSAQVSLNWLICQGTIPIPGAKNAAQARENAGALGWQLSVEDCDRLSEASESCE